MNDERTLRGTDVTAGTEATPAEVTPDPPVPVDTVFAILASDDRRTVVAFLLDLEADASVPVSDIATHVHDQGTVAPGEGSLERVEYRLQHTHLPKLLGANLVEYDGEAKLVTPTEQLDALRPFVGLASDYEAGA